MTMEQIKYYELSNDMNQFLDTYHPKDEGITSLDEMKKIMMFLEIDGKDNDELRSIRNSVVKFYSDKIKYLHDSGNHEEAFNEMESMQSVTCVIDHSFYARRATQYL